LDNQAPRQRFTAQILNVIFHHTGSLIFEPRTGQPQPCAMANVYSAFIETILTRIADFRSI